ncbi:hypothetical protein [Nocardioides sp.]|uniref:hypothetical protein n=1 Tax=Nocardioides sp. TaxID=35761 RepID=UPI00286D83F7|nr:hypothetical protein [Nocardioides sp.]
MNRRTIATALTRSVIGAAAAANRVTGLVHGLTGDRLGSEKKVFDAVATLGVDTIETVLLPRGPGGDHQVAQAKDAHGAKLTPAQGGRIKVDVRHGACS